MSSTSQMKQNFCLPINLDRLQNDRLRLIPIESCTDANLEEYINETCIKHPELWDFFPVAPHKSVDAFKAFYDQFVRSDPAIVLFAILLKAGKVRKRRADSTEMEEFEVPNDTFAGTTGLIGASAQNSVVEIGYVMLLPKFHRTFVNTVATCLLLQHLLDPVSQGDLQMRRVQWQANSINTPSIKAAQRLGFTLEGILRWQGAIADSKTCVSEMPGERSEGRPSIDTQGRKLGPGRHSAMLALCWDDWLEGKRDHVLNLLNKA